MANKKECNRCGGVIDDKSNYYVFTEMNKSKLINTDYCHRKCWDTFLERVGDAKEAMGIVRGLKSKMQEMGMLPDEVVEVKA